MICETCHCDGEIMGAVDYGTRPYRAPVPCPDCNGAGFTHCCEGERAQPDAMDRWAARMRAANPDRDPLD